MPTAGAPRAADRANGTRLFDVSGPDGRIGTDGTMIEVGNEPKSAPVPAPAREPVRRGGPPPAGEQPALLIEHGTKPFGAGRKKKSGVAVNDVTNAIPRGETSGELGAAGLRT